LLFVIANPFVHAQTLITTYPSWNGSSGVGTWGSGTPVFGQTFTVPTDGNSVLTNFTFSVETVDGTDYQAAVYAWDGSEATGSALFSTSTLSLPGSFSFQTVNTDTGNLTLQAGQQYVAFFSYVSGAGGPVFGSPASSFASFYDGGDFVSTSGTITSTWSNTNGFGNHGDLAFNLNFTPAPEPSTWVLMLGGLALMTIGRARQIRLKLR